MAVQGRASKARATKTPADPAQDLLELIETERTRLMQAESLLQCLLVALDAEEGESQSPYYPNMIELASELLTRSIGQLDSLRLRPYLEQAARGKEYGTAEETIERNGSKEVKESAEVVYLY